jgi:hypothetical protein
MSIAKAADMVHWTKAIAMQEQNLAWPGWFRHGAAQCFENDAFPHQAGDGCSGGSGNGRHLPDSVPAP